MKPTVSIIITYYNQDMYIFDTVLSARGQGGSDVEVIVVDDGSSVPLSSSITEMPGVRVERIENIGCPGARNYGYSKSSGEYLIFLDGDDRLAPQAVESHLRIMREQPETGLVFGAVRRIDEQGREVRPAYICRPRKNYFRMFLECNPIECPAAAMIRRDIFQSVGCFDEDFRSFGAADDYDLYIRLAQVAPVVQHTACIAEYRQHGSNLSSDTRRMEIAIGRALDRAEANLTLTAAQKCYLMHGRARWNHVLHPRSDPIYKLYNFYFKAYATLNVSFGRWIG